MDEPNKTETELVAANPVQMKELSMTPTAIAKRASRARKAAREDADQPEEVRKERAKARVEAGWKKNWDALSKEEKATINEQICQSNAVHKLMDDEVVYALTNGKELTGDDISFFKNIFIDAEEFATRYPPTEDAVYLQVQRGNPADPVDFTELEPRLGNYPPFFRLYGAAVDHIRGMSYTDFLRHFSAFYKKYRHAGFAENDEEFAVSWEKVDELVAKNKQLSGDNSYIRCYWPDKYIVPIVTKPRPLSEQQLIDRAVQERYAAELGISE